MKRLKKLAFGKTLWHGTSLGVLRNITSMGMISPNESHGASYNPEEYSRQLGFTFLATDKHTAKDYALSSIINTGNPEDKIPVVLEIDVSPDALQPDDVDSYALTWQESAEQIAQVKITGPVTDDFIRKVYFYSPRGEEILDCNFKSWEKEFENNKDKFYEHIENFQQLQDDFNNQISSLGLNVSNGVVTNQAMKGYIDALNRVSEAYSNMGLSGVDFTIVDGNINYQFIESDKLHHTQNQKLPDGKEGSYSFDYYCATLPFTRDEFIKYCKDFPNLIENIKIVFNNIALVFSSDYSMTIYTPQSLQHIVEGDPVEASRLKKIKSGETVE